MKLLGLLSSVHLIGSPSYESVQINSDSSKYGYVGLNGFSLSTGMDVSSPLYEDIYLAWGPRLAYLTASGSTSTSAGALKTSFSGILLGAHFYPHYRMENSDIGMKFGFETSVSQNIDASLGDTKTSSSTDNLWRVLIGPQARMQVNSQWSLGGSVCYDFGKLKAENIYGFQLALNATYAIPFSPSEKPFDIDKEKQTEKSDLPIQD